MINSENLSFFYTFHIMSHFIGIDLKTTMYFLLKCTMLLPNGYDFFSPYR